MNWRFWHSKKDEYMIYELKKEIRDLKNETIFRDEIIKRRNAKIEELKKEE